LLLTAGHRRATAKARFVTNNLHVAGDVDQAVRALEQTGQQVGGEDVDGESSQMPFRAAIRWVWP